MSQPEREKELEELGYSISRIINAHGSYCSEPKTHPADYPPLSNQEATDAIISNILTWHNKQVEAERKLRINIQSELNQYQTRTVNVIAFHKLEDKLKELKTAAGELAKLLEDMECTCCLGKSDYTKKPDGHAGSCNYAKAKQALLNFKKLEES